MEEGGQALAIVAVDGGIRLRLKTVFFGRDRMDKFVRALVSIADAHRHRVSCIYAQD